MLIYAKIEEGKIKPNNERYYNLELLKLEGKKVCVQIDIEKEKRSLGQNNFWHGVWLPIIADWAGYENKEECCKGIKERLDYCKIKKTKLGEEKIYKSTKDMTKGEMVEFLFKVRVLMADFGVILPDAEYV